MTHVDERLKQWCTPKQAAQIDALNEYGSNRKAAEALGIHQRNIYQTLKSVKQKAATAGYSPDHDMTHEVPSPYVVKGTSTLYGEDGEKKLQWVKTSLDRERFEAVLKEYVEWLATDARGMAPIVPAPASVNADLLSVYAIGDPHFGMFSWAAETGEDFDLKEAERITGRAIDRLVTCSPESERSLILELGDLLHADNSTNVTPAHHNALDVDTRFAKIMQVALRALKHAVSRALEKHKHVEVWIIGGNHDPHSSFAIAMCLASYYENEPRVKIDLSPSKFRYMKFGKVLIGSHHGDGLKMENLQGIMAHDREEDWSSTKYRYWYLGDIHHLTRKEFPGVVVETFRTLAARDAYHAGKGYRSGRDMQLIVHNRNFGEVERHRADVAMLGEKTS
jgi:hypothetical protein